MEKAVISAVGPDRPGIVAGLCEVLQRRDCNIEDSTMTRLGQEFASIVVVATPPGLTFDVLRHDLQQAAATLGLTVVVKPLDDASPPSPTESPWPVMISVAGHDRTGITHRVSRCLADLGINITDLDAQRIEGQGGLVYIMMIEANVPPTLTFDALEETLRALEPALGVEIRARPLEPVAL